MQKAFVTAFQLLTIILELIDLVVEFYGISVHNNEWLTNSSIHLCDYSYGF